MRASWARFSSQSKRLSANRSKDRKNDAMKVFRVRRLWQQILAASRAVVPMPPVRLGNYLYHDEARGNFLAHFRVPVDAPSSQPQLLVDPNMEHGGSAVIGIGPMSVSHDGRKIAFLRDRTGDESYEVLARHIDSGENIELPQLDGVAKAVEWDSGGSVLYVSLTASRLDPVRPCRLVAIDVAARTYRLVAQESDPAFMLELGATKNRRFIRVGRLAYDSTEQWILPALGAQPVLMRPREVGVTYTIEHLRKDEWVVFSDNSLYKTHSFGGSWDLLHRDSDMAVAHVDCFSSQCLLFGYSKCVPTIASVSLDEKAAPKRIEIPSMTIVAPRPNLDMEASTADLMMASPVQAAFPATMDAKMRLHGVPEQSPIETVVTDSGLLISLIRGKPDKPCLLQVYGAYGAISAPEFEPMLLPLVARGWSLAFAHIRGDGMLGTQYTRDKQQCVDDLNECAKRVAKSGGIVLRAASAGAFTAAAALLSGQGRLYRGALLEVPFLNAYQELTRADRSALSLFEMREWGDLETLRRIDPTEQLLIAAEKQHALPSMMLTYSPQDSRVSASSVVRFGQLAKRQGGKVELLQIAGGHGGDGGLESSADDAAEMLHFLLTL